ncbi:ExeM/NucH family extracellular endonuclease [Roseibium sp. RKSG952]|uniref:ExeM/NucH family extracellular endonuclease n=1 Tax=Roseibium sp. RKSG952 TaxID=2529384 RepID=UPI0012BCA9B9|nr:ExeM/NucH family extracellular endonuclease [Roseibium sp. RKSG952]MTI00321.1 ExeM/NucH family extracellular endonuclease [Roseibium sp. RKSG952]
MSFFFRFGSVFGSPWADELEGSEWADFIFALGGNDSVFGGDGNDRIFAGRGDDVIAGGAGNDFIAGGKGFDTATFEGSVRDYGVSGYSGVGGRLIDLTTVSQIAEDGSVVETDWLNGVEALYFEADDYTAYLDGRNNAVLAENDAAETDEDTDLVLNASDLLANDFDFDGDALEITSVEATSALGAAITFENGQLVYSPSGQFEDLNDGEQVIDTFTYTVSDGQGGETTATVSVTVNGLTDTPAVEARINEIHYDNAGTDTGEFIEIRVTAGADISEYGLELYNGSNGTVYNSNELVSLTRTTDGTYDYYVWELPSNGIQNGSPDGIALTKGAEVVEFLSYEGTLTATEGTAAGLTSTDIGVSETSSTEAGQSLQRAEDGSWNAPAAETSGASNDGGSSFDGVVINEIAVSTSGTDWEFVELFGEAGASLDGYAILQIDGSGEVTSVIDLDGQLVGENGFFLASSAQAETTFGLTGDLSFADNTLANEASSFLLVSGVEAALGDDLDADDDGVLEFTTGDVVDSVALTDGGDSLLYSENVVGLDGSFLAAGAARSTDGTGDFAATSFSDSTTYTPTAGGSGNDGGSDATARYISEIQGTGSASLLVGEYVVVSAVVTQITANGFYIQEEESDYDSDDLTSEGLFVYTGGAPDVTVGDLVEVTGTVEEFSGATQLSNITSIVTVGTGYALPPQVALELPFTSTTNLEQYEGMRVSLSSGDNEAPLTVIENFNFDRYGDVTISAGTQVQPTQLYDAQTEADEIAALQEANANNRIVLDDGNSSQNPDSFGYVPANVGDDGDGVLDSGDSFSDAGPTLRLGTEIIEPVDGVITEGQGDYRLVVDGQLTIDETTNSGAREATPEDVGGSIQVASFNVLNYFTTIDESGAGTGPSGTLDPRGADSAEELVRQTDKLVNALTATGAEVYALQELENNGFGEGSAIANLVDALNAKAEELGSGAVYAYVDPAELGETGFLGTDAITTGIIYDTTKVSLVYADYLEFEEASSAETFAVAESLHPYVSSSDQLDDNQRNRPSVAATFEEIESGETFTVVSNHFKSKGDSGLEDLAEAVQSALDANQIPEDEIASVEAALEALVTDPNYDTGNGQGYWNQVRTDAASELTAWLEGDYTEALAGIGVSDDDFLVLGDFNAYAQEDPVQSVRDDAGYTDLIDTYIGQDEAYSYVFDGQRGTLDQALASDSLSDQVTGLTEWHINADEPDLLSYDNSFTDSAFYDDGVFAASDHDPLIVGLDLTDDGSNLI